MALLILLILVALVFAVFAAQNTAPVAIHFFSYSTPPIPLFFVLGATLLSGIILSWVLTAFHRFSVARKLKGKEEVDALRVAKWKLVKTLSWRIPFLLLLAGLSFIVVSLVLSVIKQESMLDFVIALGTLITTGYKFLKSPLQEYFRFRSSLK